MALARRRIRDFAQRTWRELFERVCPEAARWAAHMARVALAASDIDDTEDNPPGPLSLDAKVAKLEASLKLYNERTAALIAKRLKPPTATVTLSELLLLTDWKVRGPETAHGLLDRVLREARATLALDDESMAEMEAHVMEHIRVTCSMMVALYKSIQRAQAAVGEGAGRCWVEVERQVQHLQAVVALIGIRMARQTIIMEYFKPTRRPDVDGAESAVEVVSAGGEEAGRDTEQESDIEGDGSTETDGDSEEECKAYGEDGLGHEQSGESLGSEPVSEASPMGSAGDLMGEGECSVKVDDDDEEESMGGGEWQMCITDFFQPALPGMIQFGYKRRKTTA